MSVGIGVGADALLGLLEQLRGASRLGRAKILAQAVKALRALPRSERKVLAIEVARQVAPKLVPALEASDGELSASQIGEFVSMVQQLEADQIAAIAAAVRSGDTSDPAVRELMDQVATTALDALAPPAPDDEPLEPADEEPADEAWTSGETTGSAGFDASPAEEDDDVAEDEAWTPDETTGSARFDGELVSAEPADEGPAEEVEEAWEPDLEEQRSAEAELAAEVAERRALIEAAPDGWRRRRLLMDLAREDVIADEEALDLVATLARASDRAWVVGMLVDRGLVVLDEATSLLEPRAAHRLRERTAA